MVLLESRSLWESQSCNHGLLFFFFFFAITVFWNHSPSEITVRLERVSFSTHSPFDMEYFELTVLLEDGILASQFFRNLCPFGQVVLLDSFSSWIHGPFEVTVLLKSLFLCNQGLFGVTVHLERRSFWNHDTFGHTVLLESRSSWSDVPFGQMVRFELHSFCNHSLFGILVLLESDGPFGIMLFLEL